MAKKLILLTLLIPIIVMISLFAATKTISVMMDIPVSGIAISNSQSHLYLDMDKNETHSLEYTVYPTNAKNKAVSVSTERVDGSDLAEFDFQLTDNKINITPKSAGSARVYLTTSEGAYRASVTVHVESTALKSISSTISEDVIAVGDTAEITTVFNPSSASAQMLSYTSDNTNVATVNDKGVVFGLRSGTANIKVYAEQNPSIFNVIPVTVYNNGPVEIPEMPDHSIVAAKGVFSLPVPDGITVLDPEKLVISASVKDADGNAVDASSVIKLELITETTATGTYYSIAYEFLDPSFVGTYIVSSSYDDGEISFSSTSKEIEKTKDELISLDIFFDKGDEAMVTLSSSNLQLLFTLSPAGSNCNYTVTSDNPNVITNVTTRGSRVVYSTISPGVANITVRASLNSDPTKIAEATVTVFVAPPSFNVTNDLIEAANDTIEKVFTLGKYEYTNKTNVYDTSVHKSAILSLGYIFKNIESADSSFKSNVRWEVEEKYREMIGIDKEGTVYFKDNSDSFSETVELRAIFGSQDDASNSLVATCRIRCVSNGINVYSYLDLIRATRKVTDTAPDKDIILQNDVISDFGANVPNELLYTEIHTTYDDNYYVASGKAEDAKIKILISFKTDVYGNGHTINANNLSHRTDSAGQLMEDAIFRGPLNFISMSDSNSSISVKGQDNICFALYDGVTLKNINLQGATLTSNAQLKNEFSDLDYTGTVVEVLGKNASIEYSRISFGRTVLRVFGAVDENGNKIDDKISVTVKNSILSEAREFIVRAGSNRFVTADDPFTAPSPLLPEATNTTHKNKGNYNAAFSGSDRESYDESFINTFVTLDNTNLRNAGLFAIGVDSHFSSSALADGDRFIFSGILPAKKAALFKIDDTTSMLNKWKNLSKTSYGAKIKLVNEVNLYTWKPLSEVDSSSIIEVPGGIENVAENTPLGEILSYVNLDIQFMVEKYNSKLKEDEPKIIKKVLNDENLEVDYVHGGIVFFGGGKNYGVLDTTEAKGSSMNLSAYSVSLEDAGVQPLRYAAGEEEFYFFMFNESQEYSKDTTDNNVYNN